MGKAGKEQAQRRQGIGQSREDGRTALAAVADLCRTDAASLPAARP